MEAERGRVLVVDDSELFLRTAASVISDTRELRLVGAVGSGEQAIELLRELRPDLVVVDRHMPGMDGPETVRKIRRDEPRAVVIMISAELAGLSAAAQAAGAAASLDKRDFNPRTLDALWLEHGPDPPSPRPTVDSTAELAQAVNEEIRALAESLTDGDDDGLYGFLCEDGCGEKAPLTLAAFIAAKGAWLDGHEPNAD